LILGTIVFLSAGTFFGYPLGHFTGTTHPRFDGVRLFSTDNHPLPVSMPTKSAASAPIVGYPAANLQRLNASGQWAFSVN